MRRPLLLIITVLMAVPAVLMFLQWRDAASKTIRLPNGAALHILGVSHGKKTAPSSTSTHITYMPTHANVDDEVWDHGQPATSAGWRARVYAAAPDAISRRLPATWAFPIASSYPTRHLQGYPEALKCAISGPFDTSRWALTWVDKNGFESGYALSFFPGWEPGKEFLLEWLPPCHSPDVILRIREQGNHAPLSQWPLIAEMPMKNPCVLSASATPVMKLPASVTLEGITLTLHSLIVDPTIAYGEVSARLTISPSLPDQEWTAGMRVFDERRMAGPNRSMSCRWKDSDITISTSTFFWSDGPWNLRVALTPKPGASIPPSRQVRFARVPLPESGETAKVITDQSVIIGARPVSLVAVRDAHIGREASWQLDFRRPELPAGSTFRILSAKDDAGIELRQHSSEVTGRDATGVISSHLLTGAKSPNARYLDIVVGLDAPLTFFEFFVLPEIVPGNSPNSVAPSQ